MFPDYDDGYVGMSEKGRFVEIQSRIASQIEEARVADGMSQRVLAFEAGLNRTSLRKCLSGGASFEMWQLLALCEVLLLDPSVVLAKAMSRN